MAHAQTYWSEIIEEKIQGLDSRSEIKQWKIIV